MALLLIVWDVAHRRIRWYLIAWFLLAVWAFVVEGQIFGPPHESLPFWFWQIVLLVSAIALLSRPITSRLHHENEISVSTAADRAVHGS